MNPLLVPDGPADQCGPAAAGRVHAEVRSAGGERTRDPDQAEDCEDSDERMSGPMTAVEADDNGPQRSAGAEPGGMRDGEEG